MASRRAGFSFPESIGGFQEVDERLRNRCRFIPWSEEHPAWAKNVSIEQIGQLRGLLGERASMILQVHDARQQHTLDDLLAISTDEQRRMIEQIQQMLARDENFQLREQPGAINQEISTLEVQKDKIMPFLNNMGVAVDPYGFAWVAKKDHYFRVNLVDTQVYLFSRENPEHCARVCIVAGTRGKDLSGTGFNTRDMLLLSKIVALQFDLLPAYLATQVVNFLATSQHGGNIFDFDPIVVFEQEFKERYPEIYEERVNQRVESAGGNGYRGIMPTHDTFQQEIRRVLSMRQNKQSTSQLPPSS